MSEFDTDYTDNIICPYCNSEDEDSWEYDCDEGVIACSNCNKKFNYSRSRSVAYTTSKINCGDRKHNFIQQKDKILGVFPTFLKYLNTDWNTYTETILPEEKWEYMEIWTCEKCDVEEFRKITKEEYIKKYPQKYQRDMERLEKDKSRL